MSQRRRSSRRRLEKTQRSYRPGVALVILFLAHAGRWGASGWIFQLPLINRLEAIVYDTRLALTMPRTVDNRVVILDIDEKSLAEKESGGEGRWPWPRGPARADARQAVRPLSDRDPRLRYRFRRA
jgi:CHASE2 domain-containing sensor protein